MRTGVSQWLVVAFLAVVLGCGGESSKSQPSDSSVGGQQPTAKSRALVMPSDAAMPRWKPDPALLAGLVPEAEATSFDKYRLRAPKGCKFVVGEEKKASSGEVYVSVDGDRIVSLRGWILEPQSDELLKTAEAAVLTLKRIE